jgi:predicted DsbA family dithiol-disulfide isomerase
MEPIRISHFSDVLCVWAYIAQVRIEQLQKTFQDQIALEYHFIPIFGNAIEKLEAKWCDRGGLAGYGQHVQEVAARFDHVTIHPDAWIKDPPISSMACNIFLYAVKLLDAQGKLTATPQAFERTILAFREAFFTQGRNIAHRQVQLDIADQLGLPTDQILAQIANGAAYAELFKDSEQVKQHSVTVSPTLIFNEGRQRLNGNVGYRVIEANIRELLNNPEDEHSWC